MSDEIKLIYTGSKVESMWLEELLTEKGIGCIRRDTLESSVQAGWADGSPEDSCRLYVESENFEIAKDFLAEYFASRENEGEEEKE
ncbi:MAG TPA: hypothetical protein VIN10_03615 [Bacteroidales bacterium]